MPLAVAESARSIPACAGEPDPDITEDRQAKVYPRVCGGTGLKSQDDTLIEGLSPRVRGNRVTVTAPPAWLRSIPACAGEPLRCALA